eukprot:GHVT01049450.1.p1 GENE.GHVT01049450.1~~GHVT01049450.1.p1  ORF type:complete len:131 (-),score=23.52 GHVT01049450.1:1780-2172(-)
MRSSIEHLHPTIPASLLSSLLSISSFSFSLPLSPSLPAPAFVFLDGKSVCDSNASPVSSSPSSPHHSLHAPYPTVLNRVPYFFLKCIAKLFIWQTKSNWAMMPRAANKRNPSAASSLSCALANYWLAPIG